MKKRIWIRLAGVIGLGMLLGTCGLVIPTFALLRKGVAWSERYYLSASSRDIMMQLCYADEGGVVCRRVHCHPDEGTVAEDKIEEIGDLTIQLLKENRRFQNTSYVVDRAGVPFGAVRIALNVNTEQGYNGTGPPMADFPRAFVLGVDWSRLVCQYLLFAILFAVGPVVIRYGRSKWRKLRPLVADDQEEEALG